MEHTAGGRLDLERADAYGRSFADVYDAWYETVSDAKATARFVADRCDGTALELGVGSGRLAGPLTERGLTVVGLDGSAPMLERCRHAVGPAVPLVLADMRALPFRPTTGPDDEAGFGAVLIAFNTLFNLGSESEQLELLQVLWQLVGNQGCIIIEALDVSPLLAGPQKSLGVRTVDSTALVVTATELDAEGQVLQGRHLEISDRGVVVRPWRLRWLTHDQLDRLAASAGLVLTERYGSWDQATFTEDADTHISVYRRSIRQGDSTDTYARRHG